MLTDEVIKAETSTAVYKRGERYFYNGAVTNIKKVPDAGNFYRADVEGTYDYEVEVRLSADGESIESYYCDCPAAMEYDGACKHVVALLKTVQAMQMRENVSGAARDIRLNASAIRFIKERNARHCRQMFAYFKEAANSSSPPKGRGSVTQYAYLVPRLMVESAYNGAANCWLDFRFGTEKLYIIKDLVAFIKAKQLGEAWQQGKNGSLYLAKVKWADEVSAKLFSLLEENYQTEQGMLACASAHAQDYYYRGSNSWVFNKKQFFLTAANLRKFLAIMGNREFELRIDGAEMEKVRWVKEQPEITVTVSEDNGAGHLEMSAAAMVPLDAACNNVYYKQKIYQVQPEFAQQLKPLLATFATASSIDISKEDMGQFFAAILPQLEKIATVKVAAKFLQQYAITQLRVELYLDYAGDGIAIKPEFCYGEAKFNPLVQAAAPRRDGRQLVRDEQRENEINIRLANYDFERQRDQLVQLDEAKSYEFLTDELPNLPEWVDIFYADSFEKRPVRPMPKVSAGVSVNDMDLLEVNFDINDIDLYEMMDILDSYRQKRHYHRLKDKTFVTLEAQQLKAVADFMEKNGITRKNISDDNKVEMPLAKAMYLDETASEAEAIQLIRSRKFKHIVGSIRHPEAITADVPPSLKDVLRDYQITGFNWLMTLASYHLGGILADDMGLGKTLQVIAFLLAKKDSTLPPSLVVAPTSLMYNWLDEIERFAPQLNACIVAGTKREREDLLAKADNSYDVLITTYNMLKRDVALYEKRRFRYCFLDEAQHIKNPNTQNARSVKKLHTSGYFALTGTPIENTLTELWSIFDYLMPGYLLSHKKFKEHYETPIVREENKQAMHNLKQHVMPFILRRMKKDVLTELPDKVERKMVNEMTAKQAKVYQAWFIKSQKEFAAELKSNGFGDSRIKILAILTRLRQIACDPAMFLEGYEGGSGKLDMLEEVVGEAVAGGHRLLIFSQFTTMLGHIGERLKQQGIPYFYLDGAVPALERINLVKKFNEGNTSVFLISLKAGGTGLNLTGADMVIHFDPWWNPAVEDQATDRAYRLGQKNNVQVLKFITKNTVEEKIYKLQEKKKDMIDQMIQPGENFLSKLTEQEICELFK